MDGGAWWAAVHGVARSRTRLSDFTFTFYFHALEKEMATHSSILAWRIPGAGEPGGLPSMWSHRVGHDWSDLAAAAAAYLISYMFYYYYFFQGPNQKSGSLINIGSTILSYICRQKLVINLVDSHPTLFSDVACLGTILSYPSGVSHIPNHLFPLHKIIKS